VEAAGAGVLAAGVGVAAAGVGVGDCVIVLVTVGLGCPVLTAAEVGLTVAALAGVLGAGA
jgi:hypothetical protein